MSRNYANISTSIWRPESDFGNLTFEAQWAHFMLSTQADISAAGVLSLNVKRWARRSKNGTRDLIVGALQELQAAGKVVYDLETEELLVCSFVRDDGGYSNRKRRPVIERAAREVESLALRQALVREFASLGLPVEWVGAPDVSGADSLSGPNGIGHVSEDGSTSNAGPPVPPQRTPESAFSQVDRLSDGVSDAPSDGVCRSDGVVVTQEVVVRPQPSTPQPVPPSAGVAAAVDEPPLFDDLPGADADTATEATPLQRAFGVARWWIELRRQRGTPVVASGKDGALHKLKSLIKPFAESGYLDAEIQQALEDVAESIPSSAQLDRTLTRIREGTSRPAYERRSGYPSSYPDRTGIAARDSQRVSPATRKFQQAQDIAAKLDQQFANGATL